MIWVQSVAFGVGGVYLANSIPHIVSGLMGRPFQSPFAKPPGEGLSSSTVNVLWGGFNLTVAYLLIFHVGVFDLKDEVHVACVGLPARLASVGRARAFGRFHGGNDPLREQAANHAIRKEK